MAALIEVRSLSKSFPSSAGWFRSKNHLRAVQEVSFEIEKRSTLGLVGESGCGKSTLGRCLLRLIEPSSGQIFYNGVDVSLLSRRDFRAYRRKMQIIFQDPYASLNPRLTISSILDEPLVIHRLFDSRKKRQMRVEELLDLVGLSKDSGKRYP